MYNKITSTQIETVKYLLHCRCYSLREISRKVGIAYSTVVKINLGHYDSGKFVNPNIEKPVPHLFNVDKVSNKNWLV